MGRSRVTVGVDGSPASRTAVEWAIERSRHTETTLELLTVIPDTPGAPDLAEQVQRTYEANLSELVAAAQAEAPRVTVTPAIRNGWISSELARASEETDLLVVGTDKVNAVRRLVYGTVPLRLAALTAAPLVVVPRSWTPGAGRIVLAVGDDAPAEATREFAAAEAEARALPLELVHVWAAAPNYPAPLYVSNYPWTAVEDASRMNLEWATKAVRTAHPALSVSSRLEEGPTIPRLVAAAEGAQLIVVGRGARGILHELLQLGSVAHDVLLNPPAPVAVVPTRRRDVPLDEPADRMPASTDRR